MFLGARIPSRSVGEEKRSKLRIPLADSVEAFCPAMLMVLVASALMTGGKAEDEYDMWRSEQKLFVGATHLLFLGVSGLLDAPTWDNG